MLRFVLMLSLALGATNALADREEAIKAAKEKAKARQSARADKRTDKVEDRVEKIEERAEKRERRREERAEREDRPGLGLGREHRIGKAMSVAAENEKHELRLAHFVTVESRVKALNPARPELITKLAELREKETKRHDKALARLAKAPKGGAK